MNSNIFKSIGAVVAGFIAVFVLSYATDTLLEGLGVLPKGLLPMTGAELLIATTLVYRNVYNVAGSYLTARLAPDHPMRHALTLGALGFVFSLIGALVGQALGPAWYAWTIVVLALPCAWLGGWLFERSAGAR